MIGRTKYFQNSEFIVFGLVDGAETNTAWLKVAQRVDLNLAGILNVENLIGSHIAPQHPTRLDHGEDERSLEPGYESQGTESSISV